MTSQFVVEEEIVEFYAVSDIKFIWIRRFVFYLLITSGATNAPLLLFGSLPYASRVPEREDAAAGRALFI